MARFLVEHGARAEVVDARGVAPLDLFKNDTHGRDHQADEEIISLLRSSLARAVPAAAGG